MSMRTLTAAAAAAFLLAASGKPAASDGGLPIRVDVEFELPKMTASWAPYKRDEIIVDIRKALIKDLGDAYPYYEFNGTDASPNRKLVFVAVASGPDAADVKLLAFLKDGQPHEISAAPWMLSVDVANRGYPTAPLATGALLRAFRDNFIAKRQTFLDQWLWDHVPIAKGGSWVNASATSLEIALPLPFARFSVLKQSVIRIDCKGSGGDSETLESPATGGRAQYPATAPDSPYEALVVLPRVRRFAGRETEIDEALAPHVRGLRLGYVFVKQFLEPT